MITYVFDGSYLGYLTCVFEAFDRKDKEVEIVSEKLFQEKMFSDFLRVSTEKEKASRVQKGLEKQLGREKSNDFYKNFLSEDPKSLQCGFQIIKQVFTSGPEVLQNYGDMDVLYFAQTLRKVSRERHRMTAFVRFSKAADGLFFAIVEPDFNVLPLIIPFFKNRYADQRWLIYDEKRQYGLLYDLVQVNEVYLSTEEKSDLTERSLAIALDERDELFQQLWKSYFKSTNIEARRNMKLHIQQVPKRYWKYLVEKN